MTSSAAGVLLMATSGGGLVDPPPGSCANQALNEDPHPQVVFALGLRMTNCAPSRLSRKSISAPPRYWKLIGSISSFTPWFSTQVSPSWTCSSNSNPYCRPEQPPPCTNTRSISFGLPSPAINSLTLRAAASVNSSGASVVSATVCVAASFMITSVGAQGGYVTAQSHN